MVEHLVTRVASGAGVVVQLGRGGASSGPLRDVGPDGEGVTDGGGGGS